VDKKTAEKIAFLASRSRFLC